MLPSNTYTISTYIDQTDQQLQVVEEVVHYEVEIVLLSLEWHCVVLWCDNMSED